MNMTSGIGLDMDQSVQTDEVSITLSGIGKTFGDPKSGFRVLDNVDAKIRDCEFVSLLGPSGCGKSTLLRIIADLIPYEEGKVSVLGKSVHDALDDVGVVFQTHNLLPWRTVSNNLKLGVENKLSAAEIAPKVRAMIETLALQGFENAYPHELSGGMRQRVAIGQALIKNPRILLMDEPFGALDALTRDRLNMELLRIWQAEKKTVVLVTHSVIESVVLSDRVLVMSNRPATIAEEVIIDLPRPRDPKTLRSTPEFGEYVVRLNEIMGVQ